MCLYCLLQRVYKKDAKENFAKYTHIVDTPEVVLAQRNAIMLSDVSDLISTIIFS